MGNVLIIISICAITLSIDINNIFNFFRKILYFKKILRNFLKRIYLKYEDILRENVKYFILFILRKFGQIMTNILRKFLQILEKNI